MKLHIPTSHDPKYLMEYLASLSPDQQAELDRMLVSGDSFKYIYRNDPAAFVADCMLFEEGETFRKYQQDALAALPQYRRVAGRGLRGLGKSAMCAWLVHWFVLTRDEEDFKIPTYTSNWTQLKRYLWPEIHKWSARIRWEKTGIKPYVQNRELQRLAIKRTFVNKLTGNEFESSAFAVTSNKAGKTEGGHAKQILAIFDEAKEIADSIFDSAEGMFSNDGMAGYEVYRWNWSTPGPPSGRFYEIHAGRVKGWHTIHVKVEQAIAEGVISPDWPEEMKQLWGGEDAPKYRTDVLGEFAEQDIQGVIPISWIEAAMDRWELYQHEAQMFPAIAFGMDVSDGGADKTVIAQRFQGRYAQGIKRLDAYEERPDAMHTTGIMKTLLERAVNSWATVDRNGVGSNVVRRLREQLPEHLIIPYVAQERSLRRSRDGMTGFVDKRSESWWLMRERLDPIDGDNIALPRDHELLAELSAPRWEYQSNGKIKVESKDKLRNPTRLGRSTDRADAVIMAFEEPYVHRKASKVAVPTMIMRGRE